MTFGSLLLLAVGVAMDATAVAAARGLAAPIVRWRNALAIALWFGLFQAGMPLIGWAVGARF
jgi:putative Mn2+ efflux pump MntP